MGLKRSADEGGARRREWRSEVEMAEKDRLRDVSEVAKKGDNRSEGR